MSARPAVAPRRPITPHLAPPRPTSPLLSTPSLTALATPVRLPSTVGGMMRTEAELQEAGRCWQKVMEMTPGGKEEKRPYVMRAAHCFRTAQLVAAQVPASTRAARPSSARSRCLSQKHGCLRPPRPPPGHVPPYRRPKPCQLAELRRSAPMCAGGGAADEGCRGGEARGA